VNVDVDQFFQLISKVMAPPILICDHIKILLRNNEKYSGRFEANPAELQEETASK
jgi:hypothetical protein